jgi:hypothetical protein
MPKNLHVETRDREGFLCGFLLSSKFEIQKPHFTIRAHNIDVASTANSTDPRKSSVMAQMIFTVSLLAIQSFVLYHHPMLCNNVPGGALKNLWMLRNGI